MDRRERAEEALLAAKSRLFGERAFLASLSKGRNVMIDT